MKKSDIVISVELDERNHPEKIYWQAEGSGIQGKNPCKSIMLSVFDKADSGTLRIDLWTKEMRIDEMQQFIYETMQSMANTYQNATNDKDSADKLRAMAMQFGTEIGLLKK
jgi:gliding motility-associated protein GldC